jgi:predicted GNAT family N-acyltransferase
MHATLSPAAALAPAALHPLPLHPHGQAVPPVPPPPLAVAVLHTPEERQEIAHLRQWADFRSEYEVDPGMAALDTVKDALGLVMAFRLAGETIATMRFMPTGHGVTLTERWWGSFITEPGLLGRRSWEVGRLVMAPEHRRADLLPRCMTAALVALLEHADVEHMHASCHMAMTRLYRRFGFGIHAQRQHAGMDCALIHGRVADVARCLKVGLPAQRPHAAPVLREEAHLLQ